MHRRRILIGTAALMTAGCLGDDEPSPEAPTDGGSSQQEEDDREEAVFVDVEAFVTEAAAHVHTSADRLAAWEEDPPSVEMGAIDELRRDATTLLRTYWDDVLPHRDTIEASEDWEGDAERLADLLPDVEGMLRTIEDVSIAIVDGEGDPAALRTPAQESLAEVIETGPVLAEEIAGTLPP